MLHETWSTGVSNLPHTEVLALSSLQWSCHERNCGFAACFSDFSKIRVGQRSHSARSVNQNDGVKRLGKRRQFAAFWRSGRGPDLRTGATGRNFWRISSILALVHYPNKTVWLEQRRRRRGQPLRRSFCVKPRRTAGWQPAIDRKRAGWEPVIRPHELTSP